MTTKPTSTILHGDCLELLRTLDANSVDAVVTDPPAGIAFMGKDWDAFRRRHNPADVGRDSVHGRMSAHAPHSYGESDRGHFIEVMTAIFQECMRVVKPGGHALVWALPRTSHWTATALEDAGWEIRDCLYHIFGSGFPKSLDVSKAIDKAAGASREVVGTAHGVKSPGYEAKDRGHIKPAGQFKPIYDITAPATDAARQWDGWGTALKPAVECWWLCRKPLAAGNVAANVLAYGTGAINVDACRVAGIKEIPGGKPRRAPQGAAYGDLSHDDGTGSGWNPSIGRWPANLLLSHAADCTQAQCVPWCPAAVLDGQSGERTSGSGIKGKRSQVNTYGKPTQDLTTHWQGDTGGASRYFAQFYYSAKASRRERNMGLDGLPVRIAHDDVRMNGDGIHAPNKHEPQANHHPTVKPLSLMRWLCRLITPAGGTVLDPFGGSGTTAVAAIAEGYNVIVMEREADYLPIIHARTAYAAERLYTPPATLVAPVVAPVMPAKPQRCAARRTQAIPDGQLTLWEVEGTPA